MADSVDSAHPVRRVTVATQGRASRAAALTVLPALLAALLYGRHLAEGLVADDFEYASWAHAGLGTLLRHVTVDSSPQMVRPLPGLVWTLAALPLGAALLHGLSVLLHAANGLLIAASVRRRCPRPDGHAAGAADPGAARAVGEGESGVAQTAGDPAACCGNVAHHATIPATGSPESIQGVSE